MEPNKVIRTVQGTKDGVINALGKERAAAKSKGEDTRYTLRERFRFTGQAEGLEFAIDYLRDWDVHNLPVMLTLIEHLALLRAGDIEPVLDELQTQIENYPKGDRYIAGVMDRRSGLHRQAVALRALAGAAADALRFGLDKPVREG